MSPARLLELQTLLQSTLTFDAARQITSLCSDLAAEKNPYQWFFLLLNQCFGHFLDDRGPVDTAVEPILREIQNAVLDGLEAIEGNKLDLLIDAANGFARSFTKLAGLM